MYLIKRSVPPGIRGFIVTLLGTIRSLLMYGSMFGPFDKWVRSTFEQKEQGPITKGTMGSLQAEKEHKIPISHKGTRTCLFRFLKDNN